MGSRGQPPLPFSQGPFVPYPHSPALIGSNGVFLFTPQPLTPRLGTNGGMLPLNDGPGAAFGYSQQGVPGGNTDGYQRQSYAPQTAFPFPDITPHGDPSVSMPGEIKSESQLSSPSQSLHKQQPLMSNGSMIMPFNIPSLNYEPTYLHGTGNSMPLNHGQINSNNNNSTAGTTDSSNASTSQMTSMNSSNSFSYMPRFFPGTVPPSPGFLMAHTCEFLKK